MRLPDADCLMRFAYQADNTFNTVFCRPDKAKPHPAAILLFQMLQTQKSPSVRMGFFTI
jgi:hypothetical protein